MIIAITILIYIVWISDVLKLFLLKNSDQIITIPLMVLISWYHNVTWGIVMLCVSVSLFLIGILLKND